MMSSNKAVTFDGFSDIWFKNTKKWENISDMWNQKFFD